MPEFISFFVILLASLFLSSLGKKLHLPWAVALIVAGVMIGPGALDIFSPNHTFEFLGQIGLVFLMFMAGLETDFSSLKRMGKEVGVIVFSNTAITFLAGAVIAAYFGYALSVSVLLGIIFISSSLATVAPTLESKGYLSRPLGRVVVGTAIIRDIGSLILLSFVLQRADQLANLPLPLFYIILFAVVLILFKIIPKIRKMLIPHYPGYRDLFEREVRVIFFILLGTVVVFELLGLHPIVAGFFAGMVLANSIKSELFKEKLHVVSYGLFIPVFFVVVGAQVNLSIFIENQEAWTLAIVIGVGSVVFNFVSGWLGAKIAGFKPSESGFIAGATIPQLSTTLAAAFAAQSLGLLDDKLIASIIFLSIFSTIVGGLITSYFLERLERTGV